MALPKIMVAPNGARLGKADHPALPVTIAEIVACAAACWHAGAGGIHAHVRDADLVITGEGFLDAQSFDGKVVREGHSGDVLGHCYNSLAWLANKLGEHGKTLKKGMIVSTGSMVACQFVPPPRSTTVAP